MIAFLRMIGFLRSEIFETLPFELARVPATTYRYLLYKISVDELTVIANLLASLIYKYLYHDGWLKIHHKESHI